MCLRSPNRRSREDNRDSYRKRQAEPPGAELAGGRCNVRTREFIVTRESYKTLSEKAAAQVREVMPWDLEEMIATVPDLPNVRQTTNYV